VRLGGAKVFGLTHGRVDALAVSADRSALAMVVRPERAGGGCGPAVLVRRDLVSGEERTLLEGGMTPRTVSVSADGNRFATEVRLAGGAPAVVVVRVEGTTIHIEQLAGEPGCRWHAPAWRGEQLVVFRWCQGRDYSLATLTASGRITGTPARFLFPLTRPDLTEVQRMDFDRTGSRLLLSLRFGPHFEGDNGYRLWRWDGGESGLVSGGAGIYDASW
jgi:hypothetical protein